MSEHGSTGSTGPAEPGDGAGAQPQGPDRQPTAPQPQIGQAGYAQQPYGGQHGSPPYGQPYGRPAYGPPSYAPYPPSGPAQPPAGAPSYWGPPRQPTAPVPAGFDSVPPPARRPGRVRMGLAGLVAGALIGGAAGAGVATLGDDDGRAGGSTSAAQNVVIENPESATTATAAAAKAAPSVVTVYVTSRSSAGSGSGVVLTEDGFVVTNNHVVESEGGTVQVRTSDGTLYDAEVVGTDPSADIAVLRLDGAEGLTPATFADSDDVQVGDVAVAIGAPLGLSNTVTDGIISATGRAVQTGATEGDATVIDAIQTDAAINPGNSGGALVNGAGEVIGINTAIATVASGGGGGEAQSGNIGVGFAIPSNAAKRIADEIRETGKATRAFLGVSATTAAAGANTEVGTGAEVVSLEPDSAAGDAGIEVGDVITAVGDRPITSSTELTAAVRSEAPGATVELTLRRGGSERTVEVTLGTTG